MNHNDNLTSNVSVTAICILKQNRGTVRQLTLQGFWPSTKYKPTQIIFTKVNIALSPEYGTTVYGSVQSFSSNYKSRTVT